VFLCFKPLLSSIKQDLNFMAENLEQKMSYFGLAGFLLLLGLETRRRRPCLRLTSLPKVQFCFQTTKTQKNVAKPEKDVSIYFIFLKPRVEMANFPSQYNFELLRYILGIFLIRPKYLKKNYYNFGFITNKLCRI